MIKELSLRKKELMEVFEKNHSRMAAVIVEPLIQGAGGMVVQSLNWLTFLVELAKKAEIPVIFDEVFSGMGRVGGGGYFAYQRANLNPDIICIAKGLTGGNLPLALTLSTEEIFEAFLDDRTDKALLHGHSFTANPIACAAANATLQIYQSENLIQRSSFIEQRMSDWVAQNQNSGAENIRNIGSILAFELPGSGTNSYHSKLKSKAVKIGIENGVLFRPLGNTIYLAPPLTITDQELTVALTALDRVVQTFDEEPSN